MPSIERVRDWYAQSFEVCLLIRLAVELRVTHDHLGTHDPTNAKIDFRSKRTSATAGKAEIRFEDPQSNNAESQCQERAILVHARSWKQ